MNARATGFAVSRRKYDAFARHLVRSLFPDSMAGDFEFYRCAWESLDEIFGCAR